MKVISISERMRRDYAQYSVCAQLSVEDVIVDMFEQGVLMWIKHDEDTINVSDMSVSLCEDLVSIIQYDIDDFMDREASIAAKAWITVFKRHIVNNKT